MEEIKVAELAKVAKRFNCEYCNYRCSKKSDYDKHLSTLKHKKTEMSKMCEIVEIKVAKVAKVSNEKFTCLCGKIYKQKFSLERHKRTCNHTQYEGVEIEKATTITEDIVKELLNENKELRSMMMEKLEEKDKIMMEKLAEKDKALLSVVQEHQKLTIGNNSNNTITNNNQFNINMFLNEECKDAINMSDFIQSIKVSLEQLQYTTNNGLDKGITKVIMDNMNKLSKYERPLHCSDLKRETIYIKEDDKWEKDTHKDKIKKAINKTSNKNYTALCDWTSENPEFMKQDDKQHFYAKTASTIGKSLWNVEDKIIKSICKDNIIKE
tara:strand:- start:10977 stop:11948 length:972 start_codon:yes stop_codon:yes gene_type:complete